MTETLKDDNIMLDSLLDLSTTPTPITPKNRYDEDMDAES